MTIITVSGLPGSGTTTLAGRLGERLHLPVLSAGEVFRHLADGRHLTLEELGDLVDATPTIDLDLDRSMAAAVRSAGRCIAEGRLVGVLLRSADLRVWCYAPDDVRAARVFARSGETRAEMERREAHELARYQTYGADPTSPAHYDLCVNTGTQDAGQVERLVLNALVGMVTR